MTDRDKAAVPQEQSGAVVEACVANVRALLDMCMDDYFRGTQGLDDLSEGLGFPAAAVREMTYREVCGHIADRVPSTEASGSAVGTALWPLTAPYRREYERYEKYKRDIKYGSHDAAEAERAKKLLGKPPPAWYPFITYYLALVELYGEDDTLMEALFNGLYETGCGNVIPLHKYIHIIGEMRCVPREKIVYDLLVRPYARQHVETD